MPPGNAAAGGKCCGSNKDIAAEGGYTAHGVCCPGRDIAVRRKKGFNWKGFNWFVRMCYLCVLIRGLQNLDAPCKGDVFTFFLRRAKRTKKHARTCKKLPVASFCASETAETGRIANGREQGDHVSRRLRFANLWTPGTIQSSVESNFAKISGGSYRNRFCPQIGGVKALNRCKRVTAVQTQD